MKRVGAKFVFDRRVELMLANIDTVREILRIAEPSEEWEESWEGFKKELDTNIKQRIPDRPVTTSKSRAEI